MKQLFNSYLSLGSNLNNKLENLQEAVSQINSSIGRVTAISKIYSTPSWGFDGEEFYNICIKLETSFDPESLLQKLLQLEITLGRKSKTSEGYENRCIDIDIILYENEVIDTDNLTIPHPRAAQRKFVLIPLVDIYNLNAIAFENITLRDNIHNCKDTSIIKTVENQIIIL